jgi:hypothetical protein
MSVDGTDAGASPGDSDPGPGPDAGAGSDTGSDAGSGSDTGGDSTGDSTGDGTDPGTGGDQDQAQNDVRAEPEVDDSQASVGDIPADPAAEVAQYDTNFDGTAVA